MACRLVHAVTAARLSRHWAIRGRNLREAVEAAGTQRRSPPGDFAACDSGIPLSHTPITMATIIPHWFCNPLPLSTYKARRTTSRSDRRRVHFKLDTCPPCHCEPVRLHSGQAARQSSPEPITREEQNASSQRPPLFLRNCLHAGNVKVNPDSRLFRLICSCLSLYSCLHPGSCCHACSDAPRPAWAGGRPPAYPNWPACR